MTQNNTDILQLFARRLSVCRHRISAETLVQYLKNGEFGFSFDKANSQLITNDTVFAAETEQLVNHIRAIFNEPHISLKKENIVRNVSVASKMDTRSVDATYKDEKLWSVRRDIGAAPEFVHTYVYEDDLAIYENRFICYLLNVTLEAVTKKLKQLCSEIKTFNRKIDQNGQEVAYSSDVYVKYTDEVERYPLLSSFEDPSIFAIRSLIKSKSILSALKSSELYAACEKAGAFPIHSLSPTNILTMDSDYNFCYLFYLHYLNAEWYITSKSTAFANFILVHVFSTLIDQGFTLSKDSEDLVIGEHTEIRLKNLVFENKWFKVAISKNGDEELLFEITETVDGCSAKYLFRIVSPEKPLELGTRTLKEYAKELDQNRAADITRVFLICAQNAVSDQIVTILAGESTVSQNLAEAIRSITILAEGVSFLHKRYCPVCGSPYLAPEENDYSCSSCNTLYHMFSYESRDLIWIKRLPDVAERKAKTAEKAVPAMTGTAKRKVVSKSFEGKLRQATSKQDAYYADLKNYLLRLNHVKSRMSWSYDSFNVGRNPVFRIAFRGRTMVVYFALDPKDYIDSKYFTYDMGGKKKFEKTPLMMKVKSARGVKYAKELIDVVCNGLDEKKDFVAQKYHFSYMSNKELLEKGLLKESFVNI